MIAWLPEVVVVVSTAALSTAGYVMRKNASTEKRLTIAEAVIKSHDVLDAERFENIGKHLTIIRDEQKSQTEKLDRLIDKFI